MKGAFSVLLLCFLLASCNEEKTVKAEKPVEAEKTIQERAEAGDADAQYNMGMMYDNGDEVPQDKDEAMKWMRKAAEKGNAKAQFRLSKMYAKGQG
ncbi:sel1 repeat family protein, partial [Akkermansiaceae bacterium]|nr:sel1 repeat family protein [Akkermansiaceae bacterium]